MQSKMTEKTGTFFTKQCVRIAILGERCVGKSALIRRWSENTYVDRFAQIKETNVYTDLIKMSDRGTTAFTKKSITIKNQIMILQTWEIYRSLSEIGHDYKLSNFNVVLCLIDLTNRNSYLQMKDYLRRSNRHGKITLLVATKNDNETTSKTVSLGELTILAKEAGTLGRSAIITSAKTGEGVDLVFEMIAKHVIETSVPISFNKDIKEEVSITGLTL